MKRIRSSLLFILLFFFCESLCGQLWKQYADSAKVYNDQKNKALELYGKVRDELKKDSAGTITYAVICDTLATIFLKMGQYKKAEPLLLEAKEIREKMPETDIYGYAKECMNLGVLYYNIGQYTKAELHYLKAKQIWGKVPGKDNPDYARSCYNLAILYTAIGRLREAESFCAEAKQLFGKLKGKENPDYALTCNSLGNIYRGMGRYEKAMPLLIEAKQIMEKKGDRMHPYYNMICNNLASLYMVMGLNQDAEPLFLEVKAIKEKLLGKGNPSYALVCNNLGNLYSQMGQLGKAESFYLEAREIRGRSPGKEHPDYAETSMDLAVLYMSMGQYEKAEPLYQEARQINEKVYGKEHPLYSACLMNLAILYMDMGQYEKAEPLYLESKEIIEGEHDRNELDYAKICDNLGILYKHTGQFEKAESLYLKSRQIKEAMIGKDNSDYTISCHNLASLYFDMGQYQKAEFLLLEASKIRKEVLGKRHPMYGESCLNLATVYWNLKEYERANYYYKEALESRNNQLKNIFDFTIESEKKKYLKNITNFEDYYLSFTASVKSSFNPGLSYDVSLSNRDLILSSSQHLRKAIYNTNDSSVRNKYDTWISSREQLAFWYAKPVAERPAYVKDLEEQSNTLEKELTRLSSAFRDQNEKKEITWQIIRDHLKPGEAAIEFAEFQYYNGKRYTDSTYYIALLLRKDRPEPQLIQLFEKKQLDTLLNFAVNTTTEEKINGLYRNNKSAAGNNMSANIYQLIWQPLEKSLKGITKIYFAPAGNLHRISFAALPVHNQQVLSDKYQLVQVSTTAFLAKSASYTTTSSDNIHLYGAIQYDADSAALKSAALVYPATMENSRSLPNDLDRGSGGWPLLPGTEKEIHDIEKLGNEKKFSITAFRGVNATEESFKWHSGKLSPVVLHVATHGFFNPDPQKNKNDEFNLQFGGGKVFRQSDNPLLRCALLFAGANNKLKDKPVQGIEDGILTAYEVSNMYLPDTKLVVLSACETALGDIEGNEVYGLQRSFKIAGVQNLVMSLWKVPDAATADFMQLFYKNLFSKQAISNAFYNAQQIMKNKYRAEPYKWAAWVLVR